MSNDLTIYNPQAFEVTCTIQQRTTEVIQTHHLQSKEKWIVPPVLEPGMWIAFHRTYDNKFLASTVLKAGTTLAQILLDLEIGVTQRMAPTEKLIIINGTDQPVTSHVELQGDRVVVSHNLAPAGQPGDSYTPVQQPTEHTGLWIYFTNNSGDLLTSYIADYSIASVTVTGKEHYIVGTPY